MRPSLRALIGALLLGTILVPAPARAEGASLEQATTEQKVEARKHFIAARQAFEMRRFVDALDGFRASYEVVASPNTRLMIALTLRELGRNAEAYDELDAVVHQAEAAAASDPKYQSSAESARKERDLLRGKVGMLTVAVQSDDPDATLTVGGRPLDRERWGAAVPVEPGLVVIAFSSEAGSAVRKVRIEPGGEASVAIGAAAEKRVGEPAPSAPASEPAPPVEPSGWTGHKQRIVAYSAAGLAGAAFILSGVFGGLALAKHDELEKACGEGPCPEQRQDDIDAGRTYKTVSNAMIAVGAVALGTGVALYLTALDDEVEAALLLGPATVSLRGRF